MKKPIFRWTIGSKAIISYEILEVSIKSVLKLFGETFDYYVLYNKYLPWAINKLKKKYKNVNFLEQNYYNFPHILPINANNGSMWKVCPARFDINVHEIICDNDLIFLKKPEAILEFLNSNKNFIAEDSLPFSGRYSIRFNKTEGYNSGLIGLHPGFDFTKEISKEIKKQNITTIKDYGDEQGLLSYLLVKDENCIVGKSYDFVSLHKDKISLKCFKPGTDRYCQLIKNIENIDGSYQKYFIDEDVEEVKKIIHQSSTVHFLEVNRCDNHYHWNYFKNMLNYVF